MNLKFWQKKPAEKRSRAWLDDFWFRAPVRAASSGVAVTEASALTYSVVFSCVKILSETIASLPLILYRRTPTGKIRATDHPLYRLLHDSPNKSMTAYRWRCAQMAHLATWGNCYAEIQIDSRGEVRGLWPLNPALVKVEVEKAGKNITPKYIYSDPFTKNNRIIPPDNMLHIASMGADGMVGYSPISLHREAIGLGMAMQEFGSRFFGEGTHPGMVVSHPGKLSAEAHKNLTGSLADAHAGLGRSHKLLLLEEDMKISSITIPPEDCQFLESRQFQTHEICRIFRIPPHLVADLERATFSNIEHQSIEFVVHTIRPWLVLWEQELNRSLLLEDERESLFFEFLVDGLLRGDIQSRYEAYRVGREGGWLSANDVRRMENLDEIEHGDDYLMPLNFQIVGQPRPDQKKPESDENEQI